MYMIKCRANETAFFKSLSKDGFINTYFEIILTKNMQENLLNFISLNISLYFSKN